MSQSDGCRDLLVEVFTMDTNTISRARGGDPNAMRALVTAARPLAMAAALSVLSTADDAEDAAQETLVAVVRQLGELRDADAFGAWVRAIARNKALTRARERHRTAELPDEVADASDDVEALIARGDLRAALQRAIGALPETSREAVMLFYWEGMSTAAVAKVLGLSEEALRQRLTRARQALRVDLLASMAVMWPAMLPPERPLPDAWAPGAAPKASGAPRHAGLARRAAGGLGAVGLALLAAVALVAGGGQRSLNPSPGWPDADAPIAAVAPASLQGVAPIADAVDAPTDLTRARALPDGTVRAGHVDNPVWSTNGRAIAYEVSDDAGQVDLYVARVVEGNVLDASMADRPGGRGVSGLRTSMTNADWHPQGVVVSEGRVEAGPSRLYLYQRGGGVPTELLPPAKAPGSLTAPDLSADGDRLVYVADDGQSADIYQWERTTDRFARLTDTAAAETSPQLSPDGRTLVFERGAGVVELDLATGVEQIRTPDALEATRPTYAAGGRILYFAARSSAIWDLHTVDGRGETATLATDVRLPLRARPARTPDGKWVAWSPNGPRGSSVIALTAVDGSRTVEIETGRDHCGEAALTVAEGRTWLAFTHQPSGSDWRSLSVLDVTERLR